MATDALRAETMPRGLRRTIWVSAGLHAALILGLVVHSLWEGRPRPPAQTVLTTKLVRLGKERPKELLPRKAPPPPPAEKPPPAVTPQAKTAAVDELPSARDRLKQLSQVSSALDRLKDEAAEEPEGHAEGAIDGEVSDAKLAVLGNLYVTEVRNCLRDNWRLEGVEPARVRHRQAIIVLRIDGAGRFIDDRIEGSSGLPAFDRAVAQAVKLCGGVSPPPAPLRDSLRQDGVEVVFTPF